jgi:hypothetical protein
MLRLSNSLQPSILSCFHTFFLSNGSNAEYARSFIFGLKVCDLLLELRKLTQVALFFHVIR